MDFLETIDRFVRKLSLESATLKIAIGGGRNHEWYRFHTRESRESSNRNLKGAPYQRASFDMRG